MDEWMTMKEVENAVFACFGGGRKFVKVVYLKRQYGGTHVVLVSTSTDIGKRLVSGGRLLVGMVNCRVWLCDSKMRCYRCLTFDHLSKTCTGPDRSDCCTRCGANDHGRLTVWRV